MIRLACATSHMWYSYDSIGRIHEYRWGVEDSLTNILPKEIAKMIMAFACDHPNLIFEIYRIFTSHTIKTSIEKIFVTTRGINLIGPMGWIYTIGGIEAWDLLIWNQFPNTSQWNDFTKITIDKWIDNVNMIKNRLYKQIRK